MFYGIHIWARGWPKNRSHGFALEVGGSLERWGNTAYIPRNIQSTVPYDVGSVMVWGCISHDYKLDFVTIQGNLPGDQYIRDVLQPVVVPHNRFSSDQWILQQWMFNDSARLKSHWFQTVSNCSCWQTSIGQPVLFEYGTGCVWQDENRFLFHATDGRMMVWRHKNTAYTPRNIQSTVSYGGGSVMVWGCISLPEHVYDGLTCPTYAYGIQIRAHGWPRNRSHDFALEVGGYCSWTMRPGVFIYIHYFLSHTLSYSLPHSRSH
jgi:hypothetical protein